jgi:hypothetical protein
MQSPSRNGAAATISSLTAPTSRPTPRLTLSRSPTSTTRISSLGLAPLVYRDRHEGGASLHRDCGGRTGQGCQRQQCELRNHARGGSHRLGVRIESGSRDSVGWYATTADQPGRHQYSDCGRQRNLAPCGIVLRIAHPGELPSPGAGTVTVLVNGDPAASGTAQIAAISPGVYTANSNGLGVPAALIVTFHADGTSGYVYTFQCPSAGNCTPLPINLGLSMDQVCLYGTGIRVYSTGVTCQDLPPCRSPMLARRSLCR